MRTQRFCLFILLILSLCLPACQDAKMPVNKPETWLEEARLNDEQTPQELYEKALGEDTLVIYSE